MKNYTTGLTEYILANRDVLPLENWTVQGFGFMRLRIYDNLRLHIWDSRLRCLGVSDVHDHTQWDFTSTVISGCLTNIRYTINKNGYPFNMGIMECGIGGHLKQTEVQKIKLLPKTPEIYGPGDSYSQLASEIHKTIADDGTITIIQQTRKDATTARVFWEATHNFGEAIPRPATRREVQDIGLFALEKMALSSRA